MTAAAITWTLFGCYLAVTFWLAWLGHRRTKTFADFAIGGRNMGPGVAGLTLGACLASTATFVINPGFVYAYGLPALIALTLPLFLGIGVGLLVLGPGFRRLGGKATTLPVWLGQRYGSPGLRAWFAVLSLLHVFYVVLIVVGAAYVMSNTMGVSYLWSVRVVVGVVFSYVLLGGTYAHAYTNTAQAVIMLAVAVVIFWAAGDQILSAEGGAALALTKQDPYLVGLIHPESPFYRHWVEVLVCPFLVGFALVAQPHLLVKTLYLKRTQDMLKFSVIGFSCFVVFSLVLAAGIAGRLTLGGELAQDVAMSRWLAGAFSPTIGAVVSVAILAAAMSTLDGLLVAISAIVGADLLAHPWVIRRLGSGKEASPELQSRLALHGGRATIVALGVVAYTVALSPPDLIGIFGTVGTYGLLVASLPAVLYGVVCKQPPTAAAVFLASVVGLGVHLGLYLSGVTINTGLTASIALAFALAVPFLVPRGKKAAPPLPTLTPKREPAPLPTITTKRELVASSPKAS